MGPEQEELMAELMKKAKEEKEQALAAKQKIIDEKSESERSKD